MTQDLRNLDLHMHSTVSDGTDRPEELLAKVREAGMALFSVTDHDSARAVSVIRAARKSGDPEFLPGIEFSCADGGGKYHILGYAFDPDAPGLNGVIDHGHELRMMKVRARLDFLREEFGFTFPEEEIGELLALDNPGKPHIANLMLRHGYAENRKQAIKDYIDKKSFGESHVRPEEAIRGILSAGGIPVLAHPFYGSGDELIVGPEMEERLTRLIGFGLQGVEAFYSGFVTKQIRTMLSLAQRHDLYVTAGSDYHGTNKLVILGDTGLDRVTEYPDGLRRFLGAVGFRG